MQVRLERLADGVPLRYTPLKPVAFSERSSASPSAAAAASASAAVIVGTAPTLRVDAPALSD